MRVVTIIQARMGSTRLPGKVLMDVAGQAMLQRVIERAARIDGVAEVVVATSTAQPDEAIVSACREWGIRCVRGSEDDVLSRYRLAAEEASAEAVVRVTSDCPLLDPEVSGQVVRRFVEERPDYASNIEERTWPRGLDTEVFTAEALKNADRQADQPYQREHVTPYIEEQTDRFRILPVTGGEDHSEHRWTVDTPEDLRFVREVYDELGGDGLFSWTDVLELVQRRPELREINRHVRQKHVKE
jgi:spore coat polysaccharide biosynthesis protein SpsF